MALWVVLFGGAPWKWTELGLSLELMRAGEDPLAGADLGTASLWAPIWAFHKICKAGASLPADVAGQHDAGHGSNSWERKARLLTVTA